MNSISSNDIKSVLIVMDQSFGSINLTEEDNNNSNTILSSLDINPYTENALSEFANAGLRIILIAPDSLLPNNLIESGKQFIPTSCKVITYGENLDQFFSTRKSSGEIPDRDAIFVAADRVLRKHAISNGYLALPHPSIAALALREKTLFFVRVRGEAKRFSSIGQIIPYFVERYEHDHMMLLGVMSQTSISQVISHRLQIELLPLNFMEEDAMLVYLA